MSGEQERAETLARDAALFVVVVARARDEWRRLSPELGSLGILALIDRAAFSVCCASYGDLVRATRAMRERVKENPAKSLASFAT